ncbi:hypothetical protein B0H14DRAFT_2364266, partial [Mycena olivaceomarginata]
VRVGSFYRTREQGQRAIYQREALHGHIWRIGQSKRCSDGSIQKVTYRCNHYGEPIETHNPEIDPSDHRTGRTIRTSCTAHVNLRVTEGGWHVTLVDWVHNHPPQIPVGGHIPCPPTDMQRKLVSEYASGRNFTRAHLSHILRARFPDDHLEPRQVSNMLNKARREAHQKIEELGGDIQSVCARLRELKVEDPRWDWDVKLDENNVVTAIWWQSPTQVELTRRFYDVLINDNTYRRNQYGYPLNIGTVMNKTSSTSDICISRNYNRQFREIA